jgi:dolichol kinase
MTKLKNSKYMKDFFNHYLLDSEYKLEVQRKLFHILTILFLPLIYIFLNKKQMLALVIPISCLIIAADFYRHKSTKIQLIFSKAFGHILRKSELEQNSWTGAGYMAMAALIVFIICPKSIAICAFSILAVSDCLAALVGKKMTSKEFFEKSTAGSITFGVSAFLILIICGIFTHQSFAYYLFGVFAVFATTIIEARPSFFSIDDNLTIPLVFSTVMMFFGLVWNLHY